VGFPKLVTRKGLWSNILQADAQAHSLRIEKRSCRLGRDGYRTAAKRRENPAATIMDVAHKDVSNLREDDMLVLSRKVGESIVIDGDIVVSVSSVQGGRVKLCIDAPRDKRISRGELDESSLPAIRREARTVSKPVPQFAGM
jgi:carbon storage regulator